MKPKDENAKTALVFVYNADSGLFNLVTHVAHKIFSPQTYQCNLCAITHGNFGMKNEWRQFLDGLNVPFEFLHADELKDKYQIEGVELPAIFTKENDCLQAGVDAKTINACRSIADLKQAINAKLDEFSS